MDRDRSVEDRSPERDRERQPARGRWLPWLIVGAVLAGGGGIALWQGLGSREGGGAQAQEESAPQLPPRPVEAIPLTAGTGRREIALIGQVVANDLATIRARTEGTVLSVAVDVGDLVTAGNVVARLDAADREVDLIEARARLAEARARLRELETGTRPEIVAQRRAEVAAARAREAGALDNLERTARLVEEGALAQRALIEIRAIADAAVGDLARAEAQLAEATAGPRQEEIDAQRGAVAVAEAAVARTELELNRVEIVANASGTVSGKSVAVGDTVEENDPILELVGRDRLDVFLEVPESVSGRVTPGQQVTLRARALPNWQVTVPISGTLPTANAASRRQQVRVRLENPPAGLLPEMAVAGTLVLPVETAQFVVPRDVLVRRGDTWAVYVLDSEGQSVAEIPVTLASDMGAEVAIASPDLAPGREIVIRGGDGLQDGAPVQVFVP